MEEIKKEYCPCNQLTVIKKGFSGIGAVCGVGIACLISWLIINAVSETKTENAAMFYYGCSILVFISPLFGTIGMNKTLSVCPKCGEKKALD